MPEVWNRPALVYLVAASLFLSIGLPLVQGQTAASTAAFSGSVSDPSGARVGNATVTLQ